MRPFVEAARRNARVATLEANRQIQGVMYRALGVGFHVDSWTFFRDRIRQHFGFILDDAIFAEWSAGMQSLAPCVQFAVIKTFAGGWATTRRCHAQHVYPCIFGCDNAFDDWRHYGLCQGLFQLFERQLPLSVWPLRSLALVMLSYPSFAYWAFRAYHRARHCTTTWRLGATFAR